MDQILDAFLPHAPQILETIVIPVIIWAAVKAGRKFGVEIDAKHRDVLQSALRTGARMALSQQLTGAAAVKVIMDHAQGAGAGDAVRHFGLDPDKLFDMGRAVLDALIKDQIATDPLADALRRAIK